MSRDSDADLKQTRQLLEQSITQCQETSRSSRPSTIPVIHGIPLEQELTMHKLQNFPVVVDGAINHWPALKWDSSYLAQKLGDQPVTMAETPNGLADSIVDGKFVMPHQSQTTMTDMLSWFSHPVLPIRYLQLQDGCLHTEFSALEADVEANGFQWAKPVFGPEDPISNLWVGNVSSTTSLHHDPYENLYAQVVGRKKFTLFPPQDYHALHEQRYKVAQWVPDESGTLVMQDIDGQEDVPWLTMPSIGSEARERAFEVILEPGQVLYLPALWFHQVEQIDGPERFVIAINYWYDLDYRSDLWRDWKFLRKISMLAKGRLNECQKELNDEEDL